MMAQQKKQLVTKEVWNEAIGKTDRELVLQWLLWFGNDWITSQIADGPSEYRNVKMFLYDLKTKENELLEGSIDDNSNYIYRINDNAIKLIESEYDYVTELRANLRNGRRHSPV